MIISTAKFTVPPKTVYYLQKFKTKTKKRINEFGIAYNPTITRTLQDLHTHSHNRKFNNIYIIIESDIFEHENVIPHNALSDYIFIQLEIGPIYLGKILNCIFFI